MCGIAGIVGWADPSRSNRVETMVRALAHRGPDDQGVKLFADAALGHSRLSIIDLQGGHQPLTTTDQRYWIVFNGEIYNYKELSRELVHRGASFRTRSDTEVLLAAYLAWGEQCLGRLNGMFSFAIWDTKERRLFAARDRMGKKPFYYGRIRGQGIIFASEPKAILASGLVEGRLSRKAIDAYLALSYVPPRCTGFSDIQVLPPAHFLTWSDGKVAMEPYWETRFEERAISEADAAAELQRLVERAVRYRMIADVPVGAFLSGGLDSSTVVALMQRQADRPVKTFSVGFGDLIDELPYARDCAQQEGTDHSELQMDLPVAELLEKMPEIYDEPLGDSSNIPTYCVSRFAREQVKVVLTGDGGDEIFGGYDWWYLPLLKSERANTGDLSWFALRVAGRLLLMMQSAGIPCRSTFEWYRRRLGVSQSAREHPDLWQRHLANVTYFNHDFRGKLWGAAPGLPASSLGLASCSASASGLDRAFCFDVNNYLAGDILVKVDRAAMAVGLETRCPLLDPDVVEFALSLPVRLKLSNGRGKHIFRRSFQHLWPPSLHRRGKQGFGAPEAHWLKRPDVRDLVDQAILSPGAKLRQLFDAKALEEQTDHFYRRGWRARQLWALLALGLWLNHWRPAL